MLKHSPAYIEQIVFGLLILQLAACSSNQANPIAEGSLQVALTSTRTSIPAPATATILPFSATLTPEPTRPTRTPTRTLHPTGTPVIISSPEDLVGIWRGVENRNGMYHHFYEDGTCHISQIQDNLETNPNVICNYWFEDSNLYMEEVEVRGLPTCGYPGIYQVQLLASGEIRFTRVDDKCTGRVRTTAQLHEPVP